MSPKGGDFTEDRTWGQTSAWAILVIKTLSAIG